MSQRSHEPPVNAAAPTVTTLIDELLAEQRQLTAVEKFSRLHEAHAEPQLAPHYRDLIPLTTPRPGEQYAFEVNLDQCSGCKGCVTACHSLNGLDEDEAWREVGFLVGEAIVPMSAVAGGKVGKWESESEEHSPSHLLTFSPAHLPSSRFAGNKVIPLQQTVTTACHHCVEPGCLLGCPVLAYDKDPVTGIVRHLDDQCIGCSYCILKCPYDVPKYSAKRGIVRKCDLCHGRLAEGEAPACVQACPNEAIRITLVNTKAVVEGLKSNRVEKEPASTLQPFNPSASNAWLPDSPDPAITLPTTRYLTSKPPELLRAADHGNPKPAPAHWPLVLMLVLTQAGIGGLVLAACLALMSGTGASPVLVERAPRPFLSAGGAPAGLMTAEAAVPLLAAISFTLLVAGLAASVFHLGQPKKAWRVWLGWRTSWLSREAIALNAFAGVATGALVFLWADKAVQLSHLPEFASSLLKQAGETPALLWSIPLVVVGFAAVFAQAMVYADTRRRFWQLAFTLPRFAGSAAVLGLVLLLSVTSNPAIAAALLAATLLKLAVEVSILKHADSDSDRWTQLRRTAVLQLGPLRPILMLRLACALAGGVMLPFFLLTGENGLWLGVTSLVLLLAGEITERCLFFTSVAPDKMPGMP